MCNGVVLPEHAVNHDSVLGCGPGQVHTKVTEGDKIHPAHMGLLVEKLAQGDPADEVGRKGCIGGLVLSRWLLVFVLS